jgi:cell division protein FtsB
MRLAAILLIAACFSIGPAFSQAYESSISYNKKKQKAIVLECGYPEEAAENAIIEKLKGLGNKSREEKGMFNGDKGFIVFRNAYVTDISDKDMDFIVKVERKSRKEKDMTNVYLIITKNGENMLDAGDTYAEHAKEFLNKLLPDIEVANLELKIKSQEDEVTKAEKKFRDLQDDQASMEKKIKDLQDDLKKNAKGQEDQQKEIGNQRGLLDVLKAKRKS